MNHRQVRLSIQWPTGDTVKNHVQQIRVSSSALCDILNYFGSDQESTCLYTFLLIFFDELFGNEMVLVLRLSIKLEFFNSLHVLLVLVTLRLASCDSLMELGQSSTSAISSRFPEACLKRRSSCDLKYLGALLLVLSRCQLSFLRTILFFIFFENFYNAFFQRRLVQHDGLDSVCQHFPALRTNEFSILFFAQIFNEFDNSPSWL